MASFVPRFALPEAGNRYYITRSCGGYSRAIKGKPTESGLNTLRNCVGWASGRFHEIAGCTSFNLFDPVNAENIFQNAQQHGLKTGSTPKLGAMIVWQKGATLSGTDGAGHVAIVEKIDADGTITTSESGWNASKAFWLGTYKAPYNLAGYKLIGFVYQPENPNPYPVPKRDLQRKMNGTDVQWLQWELISRGYLRDGECDGDFGNITFSALCGYQLDAGLKVDAICGPSTRKALLP